VQIKYTSSYTTSLLISTLDNFFCWMRPSRVIRTSESQLQCPPSIYKTRNSKIICQAKQAPPSTEKLCHYAWFPVSPIIIKKEHDFCICTTYIVQCTICTSIRTYTLPDSITAVFLNEFRRIHTVMFGFGHLLPFHN
jgi:hypothetical protein